MIPAGSNRDPNLIHLHRKQTMQSHMVCGKLALSDTRSTRYPALVTCPACRQLFTDDERKATDPNAGQDPPEVQ